MRLCLYPQVELRDGTSIEAYEHGLSLAIVALRGSVPAQWVIDFRLVLGKYAGFTLDQRGQFEDIFKVGSGTWRLTTLHSTCLRVFPTSCQPRFSTFVLFLWMRLEYNG